MAHSLVWQELVDCLDSDQPDWRERGDNFTPTDTLQAEIALEFLAQVDGWVSDVALPIYDNQLEWVAQMMDNRNAPEINERTAQSIWRYIAKAAWVWLMEQEEASIVWD